MSISCQRADDGVLVRFWALDHPRRTTVDWSLTDWPKLVFASEGTILVESEDQVLVLPPNRALWVQPQQRHRMTCFGPAKVRTLYFHPASGMDNTSRPMHVRTLMKELIVETCRIGPLMADNRLHVAMAEILRSEINDAPSIPALVNLPADETARKAAKLILEDTDPLTKMSDLLEKVGCSRRTLERRFQAETGMSLGRWHQQARLLKSIHHLASGETVGEAAFRVGYSSPSAYIHAFRAHFGVTPTEWMREPLRITP